MPFPCSFHFTIYQDRLKMELNKKGEKKNIQLFLYHNDILFFFPGNTSTHAIKILSQSHYI